MTEAECSLCQLVDSLPASLVLASTDEWITFMHPSLGQPNCLWVQTRRHVEGLWSMTDEQSATMGTVVRQAADALRRTQPTERVYVISFGENHLHMHALVIGRGPSEAEPAPRGTALVDVMLSRMGEGDVDRAERVAASLRAGFA